MHALLSTWCRIFRIASKYYKHDSFYAVPILQGSFFTDTNRATAMPHRTMFAPYFNRESIRRAEPRITQCVVKFLNKLDLHMQKKGSINMSKALLCLMADGVMSFAYQQDFGALDIEDFQIELLVPITDFVKTLQWPTYFPKFSAAIFKLMDRIPNWALQRWFKPLANQKECWGVSGANIPVYLSNYQCDLLPLSKALVQRFRPDLTVFRAEMLQPNRVPELPPSRHRPPPDSLRYHSQSELRKGTIYTPSGTSCS